MTLATTTLKNIYTGDNAVSVFDYTFKIFAQTDLKVTEVVIATEEETELTLTTDYTVSGVLEAAGGSVTLLAGALSSTKKIVIQRDQPLTQLLDLEENDPQPSDNVEKEFDKLAASDQQLQEQLDRAVLQPITAETPVTLPSASEGKALKWDADGNLENTTVDIDDAIDEAAASAAAAAVSEANASASASAASTSASNASTSETNASASASAASTSETNAASSASAASTSETNASNSASAASTSETNASTSASNASTSATNAGNSETAAELAKTNAETAETNAGNSASAASTSASNASTSETNASNSAIAAAASAASIDFGTFRETFDNGDLAAGILTVTHSLGNKIAFCQIYNNSDKQITPDEITLVNTTSLTVDLSNFGTISGTWNVVVVG